MDIKVIIKDPNIENKLEDDVRNVLGNETTSELNIEETKCRNILLKRLDLMKHCLQEEDCRKSLMLYSRNGPLYRHYPHKEAKITSITLSSKFTVLPEIKGQNLFGNEKERSYENYIENDFKVEESKVDTLKQLQSSILRYGSKDENIWMGFTSSKYHPMLVRPGFSARRYLANLSRNLNETLVKKLMCEGYILENNLYTTNTVMPHIRRRLSDDLSRYPEPYRILKQMLMAPGPLNDFSFVWSCKKRLHKDISFMYNQEMEYGDIKILSKKSKNDNEEEFEELQYAKLSGRKKKTILSNLLMKSAMNHALKVKEEMMEYNANFDVKKPTGKVYNIHIPVIKFDMKIAITDLLTKETIQTLTTTEMDSPLNAEQVNDRFKGYGLKINKHKELSPFDSERNEFWKIQRTGISHNIAETEKQEEKNRLYKRRLPFNDKKVSHYFNGRNLKQSKVNVPQRTSLENNEDVQENAVCEFTEEKIEDIEGKKEDQFNPQSLTFRLNQANPRKHKKKGLYKCDSINGKESALSDSNSCLNPLDEVSKYTHTKNVESQGIAFAEMIKKKAHMANRENVKPYGKYKDSGLADLGDIDPTISFVNWKYKDDNLHPNAREFRVAASTDLKAIDSINNLQKERSHSRLVHLLRGQADSVAEAVLARTEGGVDFAADVNVAIRDIIGESQPQRDQVWNLEVNDMKKEVEYKGVITNLFKSIFEDELKTLDGDDLDISPTLLKLLQSGYNLKLEDLEMIIDPSTGKMMASLKKNIEIPKENVDTPQIEILDNNNLSFASSKEFPFTESRSIIASSISPFNVKPTPTLFTPDIQKVIQSSIIKEATQKIPSNDGVIFEKLHSVSEIIDNDKINESSEGDDKLLKKENDLRNNYTTKSEKRGDKNILLGNDGLYFNRNDNSRDERFKYKNGYPNDSKLTESNQIIIKNQEDREKKEFSNNHDIERIRAKSLDKQESTELNNQGTIRKEQGPPESYKTVNNEDVITQKNVNTNHDQNNGMRTRKTKNISEVNKRPQLKPPILQKAQTKGKAVKDKGKKDSLKEKNTKKKDFVFGHADETKDIMKLYNKTESSNLESIKSKKSFEKRKMKKSNEELEKEDSGDIYFNNESTSNSLIPDAKDEQDYVKEEVEEDIVNELLSDEEIKSNDGDELRQQKLLMRQNRVAQKRAEVQRLRKEEEMKRKKAEEERKIEAQRLALEESMNKKLEEERKRKEEEFLLQKAKEREEEQALLEAENRREYFRLRQIEKERQQKEEFNRRMEEARIRQAIEDRLKREEQEMREREEAAMLEKLNEQERNEYLKRKAELLEKQRLEEEEEKKLKEEKARLLLEEAKIIAKRQALEKARLEEIRKMKIEDEGLKRYLNVTPAFVWSYFEFLNILGINDNPPIINIQTKN